MIILIIIIIISIIIISGIRLTVRWEKIDENFKGCIKIHILRKINIRTITVNSKDDDKSQDDKKYNAKEIIDLLKPCISHFKIFIRKLFKSIHIHKLENHLQIGFSNYADTGEYIGYIWAILSVLNTIIPNSKLTAEPSFRGEVINFKGHLDIDIEIVKLIKPMADLLLKKEVRTLIKGVLNG